MKKKFIVAYPNNKLLNKSSWLFSKESQCHMLRHVHKLVLCMFCAGNKRAVKKKKFVTTCRKKERNLNLCRIDGRFVSTLLLMT